MKLTKNNIAVIEGDECISKWVEESGRLDHDRNMLPLVLKHIKQGDTVIDAGAYIGDHTIAYARAVGASGEVHAFEPSPEAFECLKHNLKGYKNVFGYNQGLGSAECHVVVCNVKENPGMNHIMPWPYEYSNSFKVVTIDSLKLDRCDFIKIDVEGYELEILKGAQDTIKRFKPKMLIEINQMTLDRMQIRREDIFIFLTQLGYSYANIYKGQSLNEYQMDILCLPK